MPTSAFFLLLALLAGAPPRAAAAAPGPGDARAIVAHVVEAYGGRAALERVKAYRLEGTLTAVRRGNVTVPTSRDFARPSQLRVEIRYAENPEIRVLHGARGWRSLDESGFEEASGPFLDAMLLQAARANVPWILADAADRVRQIDPLEHEGTRLIGLELPLGDVLTFRAYVHPVTFRVAISQGVLEHGGMTTQFETYYEDYRSVGGVLFAFREQNFASGTHTGWTRVNRLKLNPTFPPGTFAPKPDRKATRRSS